jgi:hypothetical protein
MLEHNDGYVRYVAPYMLDMLLMLDTGGARLVRLARTTLEARSRQT